MISRISGISTILLFLLSACNNQGEVLPINGIVERIAPQFAGSIVFEQIEDARKLGKNQEEADYYEKNARNIITTWGGASMQINLDI